MYLGIWVLVPVYVFSYARIHSIWSFGPIFQSDDVWKVLLSFHTFNVYLVVNKKNSTHQIFQEKLVTVAKNTVDWKNRFFILYNFLTLVRASAFQNVD